MEQEWLNALLTKPYVITFIISGTANKLDGAGIRVDALHAVDFYMESTYKRDIY
jgi:hypothetical protein